MPVHPLTVMAGLVPAIHVPETGSVGAEKDVDGRIKSGHDDPKT